MISLQGIVIIIILTILMIILTLVIIFIKKDNKKNQLNQSQMNNDSTYKLNEGNQMADFDDLFDEKTVMLNNRTSNMQQGEKQEVSKFIDQTEIIQSDQVDLVDINREELIQLDRTAVIQENDESMVEQLQVGDVLRNKYRIDRVLGSGNQGAVYVCTNMDLGNQWAVKHFNGSMNEKDVLIRLNHSSLPKIADVFEDGKGSYIVENFIEGQSLQDLITNRSEFEENEVINWMIQLCEAMQYLHSRHILHMDIKPKNIMITDDYRATLIDFGVSTYMDEATVNYYQVHGYSPMFCSPEQEEGKGNVDARSDVYCLGATIYYLFSRVSPKAGVDLLVRCPQLSSGFVKIIGKCINPLKEKRFQSAAALRSELVHLQQSNIKKNKTQSIIGNRIVAVAGIEKNIGTTHTALLLAYSIKKLKNCKVAIVQDSGSQAFSYIERNYVGSSNSHFFKLKGMDFYTDPEVIYDKINNYNYIIVDMGLFNRISNRTLFKMSNIKFVVGDGNIYSQDKVVDFCKEESENYMGYTYMLPLASDKELKEFKRFIGTKSAYSVPYDKNIFSPNDITKAQVKKILRECKV